MHSQYETEAAPTRPRQLQPIRPGLQSPRAWVRLPSGRRLDLINPSPDAWSDEDIAIRLARTYRWTGESKFNLPLSVAQHSLTTLALRRIWANNTLSPMSQLLELTHDLEEALLGWDCPSPAKSILGAPFKDLSDRLMHCVRKRYGLPMWDKAEYAVHKVADITAAASEAVHCVGWSREEVESVLFIDQPILDEDPLVAWFNCRPWEPWSADVAAARFLAEFQRLIALVLKENNESTCR